MVFIEFMIGLWKNIWSLLGRIRIDGVPWTTLIVSLFIITVIVGGLLSARR